MCLEPVIAKAGVGNEGNSHLEGILHFFDDDVLYAFFFFWINAEVEFVVNLKNHLRLDTLCLEALEDMDHSDLDDVGSGALNRGIDGVTLSKTSDSSIVGVDIRQIAATSEEGCDQAGTAHNARTDLRGPSTLRRHTPYHRWYGIRIGGGSLSLL